MNGPLPTLGLPYLEICVSFTFVFSVLLYFRFCFLFPCFSTFIPLLCQIVIWCSVCICFAKPSASENMMLPSNLASHKSDSRTTVVSFVFQFKRSDKSVTRCLTSSNKKLPVTRASPRSRARKGPGRFLC